MDTTEYVEEMPDFCNISIAAKDGELTITTIDSDGDTTEFRTVDMTAKNSNRVKSMCAKLDYLLCEILSNNLKGAALRKVV